MYPMLQTEHFYIHFHKQNVRNDTNNIIYFEDDWKYANHLREEEMQNGSCLKIALALQAWPRQGFKLIGVNLGFHFKDLGLLEKPVEYAYYRVLPGVFDCEYSDKTPNTALALEHFCTSRDKVTAFAMSQHKRLGSSSPALELPELALVTIVDDVLNRNADLTSTWTEPAGMRAAFDRAEMEAYIDSLNSDGEPHWA